MAVVKKKISPSAARSHTRKSNFSASSSGRLSRILVVAFIGILALVYQGTRPPPPKICGSPGGPPVTAPRIVLKGGRHLAYKENGISRDIAKYKIIFIHGFGGSRHDAFTLSQEFVEEHGVALVSFDRPGYGESDPDPNRTPKSLAYDVEELADQLDFGSKFYVMGFSMGGEAVWGVLKHIPHRLAGVVLLAPVVNYWWPGFPANLSTEAYYQQLPGDQWALRVAHYTPWLTYWFNTQKWFPSSNVLARNPAIFSRQDAEILHKLAGSEDSSNKLHRATNMQQGFHESLCRDMMVGFGKWDFDPMELENLFPNNEGSVHLWQGDEDRLVPVTLQRYIAAKLPWIHYHEIPGAGHLFPLEVGMPETFLRHLLLGEEKP